MSRLIPAGWEVLSWVEKNLLRAAGMFDAQEAAQLREGIDDLRVLYGEAVVAPIASAV